MLQSRDTGWKTGLKKTIYCLQETHFRAKDTYTLKVSGWKKIFHTNGNNKKAGVAILITDKVDYKTVYNKIQRKVLYNDKKVNTRIEQNIH